MADESAELVNLTRQGKIATLTLDNPKVNAISSEVLRQLHSHLVSLLSDLPGAVVITGGTRLFAAGADISEFGGPAEAREIGGLFTRAFNALAEFPRPTIASISGFALGGGCELALSCDFRIGSSKAKLGQPEILLGIIPGGGGTQRLARLVGPARAKDLIFSGRQVGSEEALSIGLLDRVVEPDELDAAALAWAEELAAGPSAALALAKAAIDQGLDLNIGDAIDLEQKLFADVFATDDAKTGVESFLAHGPGKATFTGQ